MKSRKLNYYPVAEHPYLSSAVSNLHGLASVPVGVQLDYRSAATSYYYLPSSYFRSDPMPPADEVNAGTFLKWNCSSKSAGMGPSAAIIFMTLLTWIGFLFETKCDGDF